MNSPTKNRLNPLHLTSAYLHQIDVVEKMQHLKGLFIYLHEKTKLENFKKQLDGAKR